jgi:hypothetical protein
LFAQIARMIETVRLQIGIRGRDLGNGGFGQNLGRDVVDCGIGE